MSLDLYQDETRNVLAGMRPVTNPEPGVFDGFLRGSGMAAMRGFGRAAQAVDMIGSVGAIAEDKLLGTGTEAQDRYFKEHDEVFGSAADYWTPRPNEVGAAADVMGGMLSMLPLVILSPGLAVGAMQVGTAEDLVKRGVSAEKAGGVGAIQGAGLGLGIWMPILGQNLWQRVFVGGAGFNALQGIATRGASSMVLEGTPAADEFKAFDGKSLTLDALLGMAFGSLAHVSASQREAGAQYWERLTKWAQNLDPSQVDAIAVLRQAEHLNVDSAPGKLEGPQDVQAHVDRVKTAIDQLAKGEQVAVDDLPAARFEADAPRVADAERRLNELGKTAETVRAEEGIAPLPKEAEAPAAIRGGGTEPPPPRGDVALGEAAGAEAPKPGEAAKPVDPALAQAREAVAENPDLELRVGADAEGKPTVVKAKDFLDEAATGAETIRERARLLAIAAQCLLGMA